MSESNTKTRVKQHWLYILKLNQGKYYVGLTSRKYPEDRIREHKNGFYSAQWVRKYGYLETVKVINIGYMSKEDAERHEQNLTVGLMEKFGKQTVRGGQLNYSGDYAKVGNRF